MYHIFPHIVCLIECDIQSPFPNLFGKCVKDILHCPVVTGVHFGLSDGCQPLLVWALPVHWYMHCMHHHVLQGGYNASLSGEFRKFISVWVCYLKFTYYLALVGSSSTAHICIYVGKCGSLSNYITKETLIYHVNICKYLKKYSQYQYILNSINSNILSC